MAKKETSWFSSAWNMTCPRCRTGKLFETSTFSFEKPFFMGKACPKCKQKYFLEPGFYYGAMFISYIIWGWFCLFFMGGLLIFLKFSITTSFLLLFLITAILYVWLFRFSRSIWIHIRVKYNPKVAGHINSIESGHEN